MQLGCSHLYFSTNSGYLKSAKNMTHCFLWALNFTYELLCSYASLSRLGWAFWYSFLNTEYLTSMCFSLTRWSLGEHHLVASLMYLGLSCIAAYAMLSHFSHVRLCATPETAAHQAPPSLGFSRQEHWSGLPSPSPMHESEKWKRSCSVVSDS